MTKERFIETINFIKKLQQKESDFCDALEALSPGEYCNCFLYSEAVEFIYKWLVEEMNDKYDYISYFLWENETCTVTNPDGSEETLFTDINSLYDFLTKGEDE